ncbi:MAG: TonB-dependent receptor [Cyclobacteriaceae bacterium]
MKWVLATLILLQFHFGFSQSETYTINVRNENLLEVVKQLQEQYKFKFSYNPDLLRDKTITLDFSSSSRAEFVERLFRDEPFKIKKSKEVFLIVPSKREKEKQIQGTILDSKSGQPMAYAHVKVDDQVGVVSDPNGRFSFSAPDTALITVSYLGYQSQPFSITPVDDSFIVRLKRDSTVLPEFLLSSFDPSKNLSSKTSHFGFNPSQLSSLPSLGQTDIFKSIQLTPGVSATDETASGLVVRGTGSAQNLVTFDGFTIYHLDHFFGIFSTLNSNVINRVDLFKGGFGAEYGGRISSVVDIQGKSGRRDGIHGSLGLNSVSMDINLETPIGNRSSMLVGFRRSHFDIASNKLFKDFLSRTRVDVIEATSADIETDDLQLRPSINFYDLYAKYRFNRTKNEHFDLNLFASEDFYNGDFFDEDEFSSFSIQDEASWSNLGLSANWRKYFSDRFYNELLIGVSGFSSSSFYNISEEFGISDGTIESDSLFDFYNYSKYNEVNDISLKYLANYSLDQKHSFDAGLEYNGINTSNEILYFQDVEDEFDVSANIFSTFLTYKFNSEKWQWSSGLRLQYYDQTDYAVLEPRLGVQYTPVPSLKLRSSFSTHHQFIHQLSLSPFGNSDSFYWTLADFEDFPVLSSNHFIIGAEYTYRNWLLNLEGYYKKSTGVLESDFSFFSAYSELDIDEVSDFVKNGTNDARGLDLLVKYKGANFESWLSYSLAKSSNTIAGIADGNRYPSVFDQRHEINLTNIYKWRKWDFSSVFIFGSGRPYTPAVETGEGFIGYDIDLVNSRRLPIYHRLDLTAKYNFKWKKMQGEMGGTLFNLYDRKNVKSRRYGVLAIEDTEALDEAINSGEIENLDYDDFIDFQVRPIDIVLMGFTPSIFLRISL